LCCNKPCQGVADWRVREGEAIGQGPEDVRLEKVERLMERCMTHPGHLPGLEKRVARVLADF
jgi:hypothetical protein